MGAEARLAELKLELPPAQAGGDVRDGDPARRLALCVGPWPVPLRRDPDHRTAGRRSGRGGRPGGGEADRPGDPGHRAQHLGSLDHVVRLVKTLGMVNSTPEFADQPKVINGFSDLMKDVFGDAGVGTRSAVGMGALPGGIAVEIEAIFEVKDDRLAAREPNRPRGSFHDARAARRPHMPDRRRDERDRPGAAQSIPRGRRACRGLPAGRGQTADAARVDLEPARPDAVALVARPPDGRFDASNGRGTLLFERALEFLGGRLDVLLHVAGISGRRFGDGPLHECTDRGLGRRAGDQRAGAFLTNREAVRQMLGQPLDVMACEGRS